MGTVEVLCEGREVTDCDLCTYETTGGFQKLEACFVYTPYNNRHGNDTFGFSLTLDPSVPSGADEVCKLPGGADLLVNEADVIVEVRPFPDAPLIQVGGAGLEAAMTIGLAPPPAPPPPPLAPGDPVKEIPATEVWGDFRPIRIVIDDPDNSGEDIFVIVSLLRPVSEGAFLYPSRRRSPGGNDDAGGDAEAEGKDEEGEEIDWQRPLHRELIVSRLSPQEGALEEGPKGSYYALLPAPLGNATLTLWYLPAHLSFGEPLERLEVAAYKVQVRAEAIHSPNPKLDNPHEPYTTLILKPGSPREPTSTADRQF